MALFAAGALMVVVGARGISLMPSLLTGSQGEPSRGWLLICGLGALVVAPVSLAAISGGRAWTLMGFAGMGAGVVAAVGSVALGLDRLDTAGTLLVGAAAVLALRWTAPRQLLLRTLGVAVVVVATMLVTPAVAILGPAFAIIAVGFVDQLGSARESSRASSWGHDR